MTVSAAFSNVGSAWRAVVRSASVLPARGRIEIATDDHDILRIAASAVEAQAFDDARLDAAPIPRGRKAFSHGLPPALERPLWKQGVRPVLEAVYGY